MKPPRIKPLSKVNWYSRKTHCQLLNMKEESFKTLRHRGQIPAFKSHHPGTDAESGFHDMQTFQMLVADEFWRHFKLSREEAADFGTNCFLVFYNKWPLICETSAALAEGKFIAAHIQFGRVDLDLGSKYVAGTMAQIATTLPWTERAILLSMSRVAAILRERAKQFDVDLSDFFEGSMSKKGVNAIGAVDGADIRDPLPSTKRNLQTRETSK